MLFWLCYSHDFYLWKFFVWLCGKKCLSEHCTLPSWWNAYVMLSRFFFSVTECWPVISFDQKHVRKSLSRCLMNWLCRFSICYPWQLSVTDIFHAQVFGLSWNGRVFCLGSESFWPESQKKFDQDDYRWKCFNILYMAAYTLLRKEEYMSFWPKR